LAELRRGSLLEAQMLDEMNERMVKNFIDVLIMARLKNGPMSGYDLITFIDRKFQILLSSGTVYATLYYMERSGLIEDRKVERKRVWVLTDKGKETIRAIFNSKNKILGFMVNLFEG